jgi:hypothetical protein
VILKIRNKSNHTADRDFKAETRAITQQAEISTPKQKHHTTGRDLNS